MSPSISNKINPALARARGLSAQAVPASTVDLGTPRSATRDTTPAPGPAPTGMKFWAMVVVGATLALGEVFHRSLIPVRFLWAHRVVIARGMALLFVPALAVGAIMARTPGLLDHYPPSTVTGLGFWIGVYVAGIGIYALTVWTAQAISQALRRKAHAWALQGSQAVQRRHGSS